MTISMTAIVAGEMKQLIYDLRVEENRFDIELRDLARNKAVLPVEIWTKDGERIEAVTRNLSDQGICMIMPRPFEKEEISRVRITGRNYRSEELDVTCKWNHNFCKRYWLSGWEFSRAINSESLAEEANLFAIQRRQSSRVRIAIPIIAKPEAGNKVLHCFSRDISDQGVCLIGKAKIGYGCRAALTLVRKNGDRLLVDAKNVWSHPLGRTYWMSGWEFNFKADQKKA